jgi:hypothetical protein
MRCEVVKILGCGFGDFQYEQTLSFNGIDATGTVIGNWSDTELYVPVPDDATSGPVVVTNKRRVPSAGTALRVRDDSPEWDRLRSIGRSVHGLALALRVGEEPEQGPPGEISVERQHWQSVDDSVRPDVTLTVTWQTAATFHESGTDPGGSGAYTIDGIVDPTRPSPAVRPSRRRGAARLAVPFLFATWTRLLDSRGAECLQGRRHAPDPLSKRATGALEAGGLRRPGRGPAGAARDRIHRSSTADLA